MRQEQPPKTSESELLLRQRRVRDLARACGFIGHISYEHRYGHTGGAQFRLGTSAEADSLTIFAEAFARDADPDDFSLAAIVAHERGHQILLRDPRLQRLLPVKISRGTEEIVASLIASVIVSESHDKDDLYAKALGESLALGLTGAVSENLCGTIRKILEQYL